MDSPYRTPCPPSPPKTISRTRRISIMSPIFTYGLQACSSATSTIAWDAGHHAGAAVLFAAWIGIAAGVVMIDDACWAAWKRQK